MLNKLNSAWQELAGLYVIHVYLGTWSNGATAKLYLEPSGAQVELENW